MKLKTTKDCSGYYTVTNGSRKVVVSTFENETGKIIGWTARALWCSYTYSDLLTTKREAVEQARQMIIDREMEVA